MLLLEPRADFGTAGVENVHRRPGGIDNRRAVVIAIVHHITHATGGVRVGQEFPDFLCGPVHAGKSAPATSAAMLGPASPRVSLRWLCEAASAPPPLDRGPRPSQPVCLTDLIRRHAGDERRFLIPPSGAPSCQRTDNCHEPGVDPVVVPEPKAFSCYLP